MSQLALLTSCSWSRWNLLAGLNQLVFQMAWQTQLVQDSPAVAAGKKAKKAGDDEEQVTLYNYFYY